MRPEVLILDEPTAGLDPKAHKDVLAMIEEVHRRTGNITILVSHNMADIARLSDKVLVIDSGHMVAMGTPKKYSLTGKNSAAWGLIFRRLRSLRRLCEIAGMKIEETILSIDEGCRPDSRILKRQRKHQMLRDITLGQYFQGKSWIHRLDPG